MLLAIDYYYRMQVQAFDCFFLDIDPIVQVISTDPNLLSHCCFLTPFQIVILRGGNENKEENQRDQSLKVINIVFSFLIEKENAVLVQQLCFSILGSFWQ